MSETPSERALRANDMRIDGMTYAKIGASLGVSSERARQLCIKGERIKNAPKLPSDEWVDLPIRARNMLRSYGYDTKEKILEGVRSGAIIGDGSMQNYGKKSHDAVLRWLGIAEDVPPPITERDQWVFEAQKHHTGATCKTLGKLYDALKSGDLKAPEVE